MWMEARPRRIFAYTEPTDMRKSFQGLLALVQQVFRDEDPYAGSLFVFVNRRGNFIKALVWDRTGFVLYAKRLERGRFVFSQRVDVARALGPRLSLPLGRDSSWHTTFGSVRRGRGE